jgi:hypothetical protein
MFNRKPSLGFCRGINFHDETNYVIPNSKKMSWAQSHDGSTFWVSVDISAVNPAPRTKHWHSQTSSNRIRRWQLKLSIAQNPYIPFYLFSEVPMQWLSVLPVEPKVRPESSAFVSKLWTQHPVVYHHVTLSNVSKLPFFIIFQFCGTFMYFPS